MLYGLYPTKYAMLMMMNVDDISGEALPHIIEELMNRGACSVHVVQGLTKKGRLEYLFWVDAPEEYVEPLGAYLATETGTLGVRVFDPKHIRFEYRFQRAQIQAGQGDVAVVALIKVKEVLNQDGQVISVKAESDDLRSALADLREGGIEVSFSALKRLVEQNVLDAQQRVVQGIHVAYPVDQSAVPVGTSSE